MVYKYRFPRPSVTVDCVVFGLTLEDPESPLRVLLVRRKDNPFKGHLALPGGFVQVSDRAWNQGEDLEDAARRELQEETGLKLSYLEQLYTFGTPGRDPRGRVISVAYYALVRSADYEAKAGSDAAEVDWYKVSTELLNDVAADHLAFDHTKILRTALARLQGKVRYAPIGFHLLPPEFTLSQLRHLYETLLGRSLDGSNFRKKVIATGVVVDTGRTLKRQGRNPEALFRFDKHVYDKAVREGFNFEI
jgi:8-oxo-dGTP diphosphatase